MKLADLRECFARMLSTRLEARGAEWFESTAVEIAAGMQAAGFASKLSLASRHAGSRPLEPDDGESNRARALVPGWNPERWSTLDALRVALILAREDLEAASATEALEEAFQYADVGELCALYRALPLLPGRERFGWRAGEGCRSNMTAVFEAVACDNPLPAAVFDDVAWHQMAIKAVFIGAPLWRVHGLDERLSPELARMALDLADERRSAGRPVQPELWLCLGSHGGERGLASIERELDPANPEAVGRRAAAHAMVRAGHRQRLEQLVAAQKDPGAASDLRQEITRIEAGGSHQSMFRGLVEDAKE